MKRHYENMKSAIAVSLIVALICTAAAGTARAQEPDSLTKALKNLAGSIQKIVDKKGFKTVAVGAFTGSTGRDGNVGPGIQQALANELKAAGLLVVTEDFQAEVKGNYFPAEDPDTKLLGVKLMLTIFAGDGTVLGQFDKLVFGQETVPRTLGVPAHLPAGADDRDRSDAIKQALHAPPVQVTGTVVRTVAGSPYGVEVLIKQGGSYAPRAPEAGGKTPLVSISKDEVYAVRLINDSDHDAAVALYIDGLSMFAFGDRPYRYAIVPPHSTTLVKGWRLDDEKAAEFKVVDFPQSALAKAKLAPSADTGTISAAFSAAWENDSVRPGDEPITASVATGFGDVTEQKNRPVKRQIGNLRDHIVVRYTR